MGQRDGLFCPTALRLPPVCDIVVPGDQNMPRTERKTAGSNIYHVMLRGINRQDIFEDDEDRHVQINRYQGSQNRKRRNA